MTQKQKVLSVLRENGLVDIKTDFEIFQNQYPEVSRSNFLFYRNQAIKFGGFEAPIKINASNDKPTINLNRKALEVKKIDLDNLDMTKFTPIKTNTEFDKIASKREGLMPGTVYMITGESGAGKTSISTNIANYIQEVNENITSGFISGEMDEYDWTEECIDNNDLSKLETIFLLDYLDASNYLEILEQSLMKWDFIVLDSFEVVSDQIKDITGWTNKKVESHLITLLRKVAFEKGSTILVIQQFTKGGTYVGSTKIKHLLTGMIIVQFDNDGRRYLTFTKNRRGGHLVNKKLYYTKNTETGRIEFDSRYLESQNISENISSDMDKNLNPIDFEKNILEEARKLHQKRNAILEKINQTS